MGELKGVLQGGDILISGLPAAEVKHTGQDILGEFERATGNKWTVENRSTDEALEKGKGALARGDGRAPYLAYISKLNFDGSGAAHFEEGMVWKSSGSYAVSRKTLER